MKKYVLNTGQRSSLKFKVDYAHELNASQHNVVRQAEGPSLVLAGAGSGKTRTLIYRVLYLLERGVRPEQILLVTFTNKAASEMRSRIEKALGKTQGLWCGTFHHVGHRMLRRYARNAGLDPSFGILDEEDAGDLLKSCYSVLPFKPSEVHFPKARIVRKIISLGANMDRDISDILDEYFSYHSHFETEIKKVALSYAEKKLKSNNLDYDDLLTGWLKLLGSDSAVREILTQQFRYCLVDEFQDTTKLQNDIMVALSQKHRNLLVVGDDAQSIYSFRGARIQNILDFPKTFRDAKIYKLETNYRSTPDVLNLANRSIEQNQNQFSKELRAVRPPGALPQLINVRDTREQSLFVAQRVLEFAEEGINLDEIAILFRARYQAAELELELAKRKIPYILRGGVRFFEQAHIKDILAYLKIVQNARDEIAWVRALTLQPGIGATYAGKIFQKASLSKKPLEQITKTSFLKSFGPRVEKGLKLFLNTLSPLLDKEMLSHPDLMVGKILESGYAESLQERFENAKDRLQDLEELGRFAHTYKNLNAFLSDILLRESFKGETIVDGKAEDMSQLVLTTIHQAKGLEWKVVIVLALSEGQFPHHNATQSETALEEERRLFYVAITRAKDELFLIHPMTRYDYQMGTVVSRTSPFVQELPADSYESVEVEESEEEDVEPDVDSEQDEVIALDEL